MTTLVELSVYGEAQTSGSFVPGVTKGGRAFLRPSTSHKGRAWQNAISQAAAEKMNGHEVYRGAVELDVVFYVSRPQGHFSAKGGLKPSAPAYPIKRSKGDWDKLARAVGDALTGIVFADDAQIVTAKVRKRFAEDRVLLGVEITVKALDELDTALELTGETP